MTQPNGTPSLNEIREALRKIITEALGGVPIAIPDDVPIFDLGVASLALVDGMRRVYDRLGVLVSVRRVFEGQMTLAGLALYIQEELSSPGSGKNEAPGSGMQPESAGGLRSGNSQDRSPEWARQRMAFLQREAELPGYIRPGRGLTYEPFAEAETALLTGATGFPGVHILAEILNTTKTRLFCLARPKREEMGRQRIERQLRHYGLWQEDETWQSAWRERLEVVEGDITLTRLGLPDTTYEMLAREVQVILHGAAHVNFIYPYEAVRATNVLGLHEMIQFAFHTRIKPFHHLSTVGIWPMGSSRTYYENDSIDHGGRLNLGYHEAKWVGERCLINAAERGLPVTRYRPGEIGGNSDTGQSDTEHIVLAAFKGFLQFGVFPTLDFAMDVAPVDYIAQAFTYLAVRKNVTDRAFHLTNPDRRPLSDWLGYIRNLGYRFRELPFEEVWDQLRLSPDFSSNALFPYQAALRDMDSQSLQIPKFDTREILRELGGSGISCPPADEKLFRTYWGYLQGIGFVPRPEQLPAAA
jgi:myxalamid-type nonribosomal peptide synthetase MxaA